MKRDAALPWFASINTNYCIVWLLVQMKKTINSEENKYYDQSINIMRIRLFELIHYHESSEIFVKILRSA